MDKTPKKVAFHTLGCKLNYAETSTISRKFVAAGYEMVEFKSEADLYVINTCSVTENADREFRKLVNRAKRLSPHSKIAVIGCFAQLRPEVIVQSSSVDLVLGMKEKFNILDHLTFDDTHSEPTVIQDPDVDELHGCTPSYSLGDRTRSFLKIQDGCDYPCTYCTIPMARGKSRSIDPDILIQQAKQIADNGVKEIVLTGVNVGDYRFGSGVDLLNLLRQLDDIDGIERIRISSIEPNLLTDDIIELVANSRHILPHFHIPLQSGSDKILALMKRRYLSDLFIDRITAVRKALPNAGIGIDVIVGFPGETEAEFQQTYDLLNSLDVTYFHVFTYSERPSTPAISLPGKIPLIDRKRRNRELTDLSLQKTKAFALRQINYPQVVLVETLKNGKLSGMTENYLRVQIKTDQQTQVNSIVEVDLTALNGEVLIGNIAVQ